MSIIKILDMQGRVVNTPVRLDALYANLLEHNFRTLDIDKLKPDSDKIVYSCRNARWHSIGGAGSPCRIKAGKAVCD